METYMIKNMRGGGNLSSFGFVYPQESLDVVLLTL